MTDVAELAAEPREIELKLDCGGPDLTILASHPLLERVAATAPDLLVSRYYDTPQRVLQAADLTLRVRAEGDRHIQTVKAGAGGVGLFDRAEWESVIDGEAPDPAAWAGTAAEPVLRDAGQPLEPLFSTVVMRRVHPVVYGGSRILVTLDEGRVESPKGDATLCELELELDAGEPSDLFAFAQALAQTVPLRLGFMSKSARGYALLDGSGPTPAKAEPVALPSDADAAAVFRGVATACLRHLRLNEAAFLEGGRPPGSLHQMRVALRRLRSALSLFAPLLEGDARAGSLADEIKRVTEPFGRARNLDVFLDETLPRLAEHNPEDPVVAGMGAKARSAREDAYAAVLAILESPEWRSLLLDVASWIEAGSWASGEAAREDGQAFAARVLDGARRRVKKRGRGLRRLDPHTRHRVRIAAKKLRYGAEFFAELYPKEKARRRRKSFGNALSDLQDHLGALNDIETARELTREMAGSDGEPLPEPDAQRIEDLLDRAAGARAELLDVKPFWR